MTITTRPRTEDDVFAGRFWTVWSPADRGLLKQLEEAVAFTTRAEAEAQARELAGRYQIQCFVMEAVGSARIEPITVKYEALP